MCKVLQIEFTKNGVGDKFLSVCTAVCPLVWQYWKRKSQDGNKDRKIGVDGGLHIRKARKCGTCMLQWTLKCEDFVFCSVAEAYRIVPYFETM